MDAPQRGPWWRERRYHIVAACFLATFTMYVERQGFSIAFTAMARSAAIDEGVKGSVFSAFYWGYGLSQIPGGAAAQRFGGHRMLLLSFLLWSTAEVLTPTDASQTIGVATARILVGVAQGFIIPSVHTVLAQCIPPNERAKATSATTSGMYLGSAAALYLLPSVVAYHGPGRVLKLVGGLGLSWLLLWFFVGREPPARRHDDDDVIPVAVGRRGEPRAGNNIPWRGMITALPIWAIVTNNFTFHYAVYVVLNWLPTYFHSLLQQDLAGLGAVKTFPFLLMFVTSNIGGWVGDWLIFKGASTRAGRTIVNTIGFWGAAFFLVLMPWARDVTSGVIHTSLAMGFLGLSRGGFSVNHMDVAPVHAGVVMGFSNTAGTISGIIGAALTGYFLEQQGGSTEQAGWIVSFSLCAMLVVLGSLVFIAFARGQRIDLALPAQG